MLHRQTTAVPGLTDLGHMSIASFVGIVQTKTTGLLAKKFMVNLKTERAFQQHRYEASVNAGSHRITQRPRSHRVAL